MWNKTRSLMLSRILAAAFSAFLVMLAFFVPFIAEWLTEVSDGMGLIGGSLYIPSMIIMYICDALGIWAIVELHILLHNITKEKIFVPQNTACLRGISWACMLAGCAFAVLGLWRFLSIMPAFAAVMFGLVMRVLKNVFEEAVEIKSENDFTI